MNFEQGLLIGFVIGQLTVGLWARQAGVLGKMMEWIDSVTPPQPPDSQCKPAVDTERKR